MVPVLKIKRKSTLLPFQMDRKCWYDSEVLVRGGREEEDDQLQSADPCRGHEAGSPSVPWRPPAQEDLPQAQVCERFSFQWDFIFTLASPVHCATCISVVDLEGPTLNPNPCLIEVFYSGLIIWNKSINRGLKVKSFSYVGLSYMRLWDLCRHSMAECKANLVFFVKNAMPRDTGMFFPIHPLRTWTFKHYKERHTCGKHKLSYSPFFISRVIFWLI